MTGVEGATVPETEEPATAIPLAIFAMAEVTPASPSTESEDDR